MYTLSSPRAFFRVFYMVLLYCAVLGGWCLWPEAQRFSSVDGSKGPDSDQHLLGGPSSSSCPSAPFFCPWPSSPCPWPPPACPWWCWWPRYRCWWKSVGQAKLSRVKMLFRYREGSLMPGFAGCRSSLPPSQCNKLHICRFWNAECVQTVHSHPREFNKMQSLHIVQNAKRKF